MSQALEISRSAWAAMTQMLGGGRSAGSPAGSAGRGGVSDSMALIRNETGATLLPGYVVGLDGVINTPDSGSGDDWVCYRYHRGVNPDPDRFSFAVVTERIESGYAGYAFITGICRVKVYVNNKNHTFARPLKDAPEWMESCAFGPAQLLYKEVDSGYGEGLIQFPIGESWDWGMVLVEYPGYLPAYSPLGIVSSAYRTSGTGQEGMNSDFLSRVSVLGETPNENHQDFVITLTEALGGTETMVPALYSGICPVLVNITNKAHTHARAEGSGALTSDYTGFARIVHPTKELRSTGTQWCYVSIPESSQSVLFPVILKKTGGEAGDHKKACSFTYEVREFPDDSGADPLEHNLNPTGNRSMFQRPSIGRMTEATYGMATHDDKGKLMLVWCNEVLELMACESEDE
jgi:hypothetical protein